jgi:hypothetical protein
MVGQLAVNDPELDAGVVYYGMQPDASDVPKIQTPLLLHYAGLDERINAGVATFEAALKEHGKTYTLHMYEGVNHAFNNDTSEARYNKEAAELAWSRTVEFLKAQLGGVGAPRNAVSCIRFFLCGRDDRPGRPSGLFTKHPPGGAGTHTPYLQSRLRRLIYLIGLMIGSSSAWRS